MWLFSLGHWLRLPWLYPRSRTSKWLKWMNKVLRYVSTPQVMQLEIQPTWSRSEGWTALGRLSRLIAGAWSTFSHLIQIYGVCDNKQIHIIMKLWWNGHQSNGKHCIFCLCAEHRWGVSLLHLHGETEGCSPLPTLLQTLLLQLHTSKSVHTRQRVGDVFYTSPPLLVVNSGTETHI